MTEKVVSEGGQGDGEEESKPRTVLVGNIPRGTTKRDLEEIFGDVGPLKRLHVQYPRDDKLKAGRKDDETLIAYVTFALSTDAATVVETMGSQLKIGGKKVFVKLVKQSRKEEETTQRTNRMMRPARGEGEEKGEGGNPNMIPVEGQEPRERKKKEVRPKGPNKKSRLIVRNLSFKATEEKLKEHFGACGSLTEVNILKKPDGRMVGCAFVQFENVPQAAKAVRDLNLKPFLGRPIAIDWALPKAAFKSEEKTEIKEETEEDVKPQVIDLENEAEVKENKAKPNKKESNNPYAYLGDDIVAKKEEVDSEEDDEDEDEEMDSDDEDEEDNKPSLKKKSDDVSEGKTLFIRNVPFSATQESLADLFKSYGDLVYALLVVDPLTEHPKGTAFVKYKDAASATSCLTAFNVTPDEFSLDGRRLAVAPALSRTQVTSKASEESSKTSSGDPSEKKDSRNLWLAREGFIRPGSSAAVGVSASDLNKRAALSQTKKQLLRNLAVFVSPQRLCIHNLPLHFTDKALRKLFKTHAPPTARVTEARIMRDMKEPDLQGKGKSKGFGFVTFTEHEHALAALRTVNNNPEIFGPNQRPIVEFSLENRKAIKAKEKRMLKSQENNPKRPAPSEETTQEPKAKKSKGPPPSKKKPKGNESVTEQVNNSEPLKTKNNKNRKPPKKTGVGLSEKGEKKVESSTGENLPSFSGLKGLKGVSKLPAIKPKGSSKITRKSLRGKTIKKKILERRQREKQIRPRDSSNVNSKRDATERHVEKYSATLKKISKASKGIGKQDSKRQKWYSST